MNDTFHLYMSLSVIILVSFFVLLVSMPLETEMTETVRKSNIHLCQKTVIDQYELYRKDLQTRISLPRENIDSWDAFVSDRMENFSNVLEQDCQDNTEEWLTAEYLSKMKKIKSAGFPLN